jgi:putative sigma-54 modulation protein
MKYIISTKKLDLTEAIRERLEKKLGKLDKYLHSDATANVGLSRERGRDTIEVTVSTKGMLLRSQETADDLYSAIDKATDVLERQIKKNKTRLGKRLRAGAFDGFDTAAGSEADEDNFDLIKTKSFELKPMEVEEAILQMNLIGHTFFVFLNAQTLDTSVVYKRKNGGYGLIEPRR